MNFDQLIYLLISGYLGCFITGILFFIILNFELYILNGLFKKVDNLNSLAKNNWDEMGQVITLMQKDSKLLNSYSEEEFERVCKQIEEISLFSIYIWTVQIPLLMNKIKKWLNSTQNTINVINMFLKIITFGKIKFETRTNFKGGNTYGN